MGVEFKPSPRFKTLLFIYLVLGILIGVLPWYLPIVAYASIDISLILLIIFILPIVLFTTLWITKYYDSITYKLTEEEIIGKRGVWFKRIGIVPYNRITNIDIIQGPISRFLGIASIKIQTAGYSGEKSAEMRLDGVEKADELKDLILKFVRSKRPIAVETYEREDVIVKILGELVKIRELLEKAVGGS